MVAASVPVLPASEAGTATSAWTHAVDVLASTAASAPTPATGRSSASVRSASAGRRAVAGSTRAPRGRASTAAGAWSPDGPSSRATVGLLDAAGGRKVGKGGSADDD